MTALSQDRRLTGGRGNFSRISPQKLNSIDLKSDLVPAGYNLRAARPPALLLGGYSVCDPPDPISNSDVKPDCADGTSAQALGE